MRAADGLVGSRLPAALLVLGGLLLWETLQPFLPLFRQGTGTPWQRLRHGTGNVAFGLLNALVIRFGFLGVWMASMEWSQAHHFGVLRWIGASEWMRWTLAILLLDFWTYTWHRLNHTIPLLWRFHHLHHSDRQMDVTTASRFHLGEIVLSSLARVPLLALLGCDLNHLALYEILLLAVVQFHHANIALPNSIDRLLRTVIVTPHLHKVHHSVVLAEQNSNFSSLFSWWDRAARTLRLARDLSVITFGVQEPVQEPPRRR